VEALTRGEDGRNLGAILEAHLEKVFQVARDVGDLEARTVILEATARRTLQRVGIVRFNPFEETGGNQSFALTILDERGDGFVVSSLHARSGTRLYAKMITAGKAETALSEEESQALRQALAGAAGEPVRAGDAAASRAGRA
jgi:hypothetical protein